MKFSEILTVCQGDINLAYKICVILKIEVQRHPLFSPRFGLLIDKYRSTVVGDKRQQQRNLSALIRAADSIEEVVFVIDLLRANHRGMTTPTRLTNKLITLAFTFAQIVTVFEISPTGSPEKKWALEKLIENGTFGDWFWLYKIHQPLRGGNYFELYDIAPFQMSICLGKEEK